MERKFYPCKGFIAVVEEQRVGYKTLRLSSIQSLSTLQKEMSEFGGTFSNPNSKHLNPISSFWHWKASVAK